MDNSSSHRIQHRIAIVDSEVPDFMEIKNGIYLSSNDGKHGNVIFIEDGILKYKNRNGVKAISDKILIGEHISIGDSRITDPLPGSVIIGNSCGEKFSVGFDNVLIGRNVGRNVSEGNELIAIGPDTLGDSSAIGSSIAIGAGSMSSCGKTEMNIGIGKDTLTVINGGYNLAIGIDAGKNMDGPLVNNNISFGKESMSDAKDSSINIVAIGTQSASNISGNNFQSIYIGHQAAQNLRSNVISVNTIGIGSEVLHGSQNVSDTICVGSMAGQNISGVRGIVIGTKTGNNITGSLSDDILIGTNAGSSRKYTDSRSVFIGTNAGESGGTGVNSIFIGTNSGKEAIGNDNMLIGENTGEHSRGNENVIFGKNAGGSLHGSNNVFLGSRAGHGVEGNGNIWIGEGPTMGDVLEDSVVIGSKIFVKGNEAVVIGSQVGKSSIGFLNRDILIGANAGMGQRYNDSRTDNRGILLIGANAGLGNPESPESVNSSDLVCIGHSAGHSNEQSFHKTCFIGNYAGSFAGAVKECVVLGNSAGVGMSGDSNIFIGPHAGFNVKGNLNILIGSHCGDQAGRIDAELDGVLGIGHSNRPTILGDLTKGNVLIGATSINTPQWVEGTGTLGFSAVSERPASVSSGITGVLYGYGKHLEYATDKRVTNLTFPYKFISQGELNGLSYIINLDVDGGTLLTFKAVPSSKPNLLLSEEIMLNVTSKVCSITRISPNPNWELVQDGKILTLRCIEDVRGICYLEAVGVHILSTSQ